MSTDIRHFRTEYSYRAVHGREGLIYLRHKTAEVRSADKLAATLRSGMGDALLYRFLALLRRDVPIAEDLEDLEWRGAHRNAFVELCDELGFERLKNRPTRWVE